jgi:hypothetical protein
MVWYAGYAPVWLPAENPDLLREIEFQDLYCLMTMTMSETHPMASPSTLWLHRGTFEEDYEMSRLHEDNVLNFEGWQERSDSRHL